MCSRDTGLCPPLDCRAGEQRNQSSPAHKIKEPARRPRSQVRSLHRPDRISRPDPWMCVTFGVGLFSRLLGAIVVRLFQAFRTPASTLHRQENNCWRRLEWKRMLLVRAMAPDVPEDHNMRRRGSRVHCSHDVATTAVFSQGGLGRCLGCEWRREPNMSSWHTTCSPRMPILTVGVGSNGLVLSMGRL
jgi:hypothetical protein